MNFLYKTKLSNMVKDFFENKIISSTLFNIICTMVYYKDINALLNYIIMLHLSIISWFEIKNYVELKKKEQLMQKHLINLYTHQKFYEETHLLPSNFSTDGFLQ